MLFYSRFIACGFNCLHFHLRVLFPVCRYFYPLFVALSEPGRVVGENFVYPDVFIEAVKVNLMSQA